MVYGRINKELRILIAEKQLFFCVRLERKLNRLGYFRIVPVHTADDFFTLVDHACRPFDVVIANASLISELNVDIMELCSADKYICNALIYGDSLGRLKAPFFLFSKKILLSVEGDPDFFIIRDFMSVVD